MLSRLTFSAIVFVLAPAALAQSPATLQELRPGAKIDFIFIRGLTSPRLSRQSFGCFSLLVHQK